MGTERGLWLTGGTGRPDREGEGDALAEGDDLPHHAADHPPLVPTGPPVDGALGTPLRGGGSESEGALRFKVIPHVSVSRRLQKMIFENAASSPGDMTQFRRPTNPRVGEKKTGEL